VDPATARIASAKPSTSAPSRKNNSAEPCCTILLINCRQSVFAQALGVAPITMSRWETAAQVPHRTTQRMFTSFAERGGIVFDERGYPALL
jgi:hypothetical protein